MNQNIAEIRQGLLKTVPQDQPTQSSVGAILDLLLPLVKKVPEKQYKMKETPPGHYPGCTPEILSRTFALDAPVDTWRWYQLKDIRALLSIEKMHGMSLEVRQVKRTLLTWMDTLPGTETRKGPLAQSPTWYKLPPTVASYEHDK